MKIYLSPQVNDDEKISYKFDGDIIEATIGGITDTFDFTGVPDGALSLIDVETGESLVESNLPVDVILSAEKVDKILYVELLNWIGENATDEERFPEWIDAKDYVPSMIQSGLEGENQQEEESPKENISNEEPAIGISEIKNWGDF